MIPMYLIIKKKSQLSTVMHGNRKLNLIFSFDLVWEREREREIFSVCHMGNWMINVDNLAWETI